jgi:hypothetical protein
MTRVTGALLVATVLIGSRAAHAQEWVAGPGSVVVTIIPAGATFFTEPSDADEPSFRNYDLGGSVEVNVNRFISVEGEVSGSIGITQDLRVAGQPLNTRTPNLLNYSGNLVLSAVNGSAFVPYATAGVGGLTLFDEAMLGIDHRETFLTSNVGGGLKWFNGRWGLRGDYRLISVRYEDDAPDFFGRDRRFGHRVYGGILINAGR